ncbi:exodeoxyribonuclease VII small subunit [Helicobacter sp. 23-1048]
MAQKTLLEQSSEQKDFETLIAQAKEVVAKLNANDIGLKDSLLLFKEGTEILKQAQDMLESAKLEFEEITQKNEILK